LRDDPYSSIVTHQTKHIESLTRQMAVMNTTIVAFGALTFMRQQAKLINLKIVVKMVVFALY